ncbi:MAG: hypothetical protein LBK02_02185 [Treponema sp.]|jgi:hypothetical protein|nr:hypothetical protein [Treponema sp.]
MTIEQTVEIPADHRIVLELPVDVPIGAAKLKVFISHASGPSEKPRKMSRQMRKMMKLYGCFKDSPVFKDDSVEIQRQMRSEWDRPWDKPEQASIKTRPE